MATKKTKKKTVKKKVVKKKEPTQFVARFYSHYSLETVKSKINNLYKLGEAKGHSPDAFVDIMPSDRSDRLSGDMDGLRCWLNSRSWNTGTLDFWCGEKYATIETTEKWHDGELGALFIDAKLQQKGKAKPSPITFYNTCMNIRITDFEVEKEE